MPGRSGFGRWDKKTGEFVWKDSEMPVGPQRARRAGLPLNLRLYTVREVAVVLRHSIYWVRDQIRAGRIRARKLGNGYFVTVLELARIMGETGTRRGDTCWNGSENFGKKFPRQPRRKSPASSTSGNGVTEGSSTAPAAVSGRAIFTSGPSTPKTIPAGTGRPLITSPGR